VNVTGAGVPPAPLGLPLAGRSVIVTRSADQATGLIEPLEALGAEVLLMPVIAVSDPEDWGPVDRAVHVLDTYDWIVLTSANGVDWFDERLRRLGRTLAATEARFAAVGTTTAARLRERGVEPALVPEHFHAEGLVEAFRALHAPAGMRVLVPRAAEAREVLPDELRALGFEVDVVPVYRLVTAMPPPDVIERLRAGGVNAVTFASGGTVRRFVDVLRGAGLDPQEALAGVTVASIGPVTTQALHAFGIGADVEAREAGAAALAEALAVHFAGASR
jgi:uroporphyrinogen III methyltransferase/synthase